MKQQQQHALLSRPHLPRQMGGHTLPSDHHHHQHSHQTDQVASLVISKKRAKNLTIDRNSHSTVALLSSQNLLKRASNLCNVKKSQSNSRKNNQTNSSLDNRQEFHKKGLSHLANSHVSKSGMLNSKKVDHQSYTSGNPNHAHHHDLKSQSRISCRSLTSNDSRKDLNANSST